METQRSVSVLILIQLGADIIIPGSDMSTTYNMLTGLMPIREIAVSFFTGIFKLAEVSKYQSVPW